jgi:hypothetical protein
VWTGLKAVKDWIFGLSVGVCNEKVFDVGWAAFFKPVARILSWDGGG